MPQALVNACGRDSPVPDELAEQFGVTRSAKAVRLKEPVSTGSRAGQESRRPMSSLTRPLTQ